MAHIYFHLGDLHSRQGDRAKAIAMLTRSIEADAQHEAARTLLARLQP